MKKKFNVKQIGGLVLASSALAMSQSAGATITNAASNGYGLEISASVLGINLLDLGPLPAGASGIAPGAYANADSVISLNSTPSINVGVPPLISAAVGANVSSGVLNGAASSNVDGTMGSKITNASGSIDNLGLGIQGNISVLGGSVSNVDVLGLHNVTLSSNAEVAGDYGAMATTGGSTILGLTTPGNFNIFGLLSPINFSTYIDVDGHADANTIVDPLGALSDLGVRLVLNEQINNCANNFCSLEVNALHLSVDNLVLGVLGHAVVADIKLGHSYAEMSAVPVPTAAWLFGSGIVGLIGFGRRRQTEVAA